MQIVWFKRDLRIVDHRPLFEASQKGPLVPLYIIEPELWAEPDMSERQYLFLSESLAELDAELLKLGQRLVVRVGQAVSVLESLKQQFGALTLTSHQETWNHWTYERDIAVKNWCRQNNIEWIEHRQFAVTRRMQSRNGWADNWHQMMRAQLLPAPEQLAFVTDQTDDLPTPQALSLQPDHCDQRQTGGRAPGLRCLESFLHKRGQNYTREMSSPLSGYASCSRLSPHLAFGTLSMREIYHAYQARSADLYALPPNQRGNWPRALKSFSGRLHWHCHFIQKLEDEPRIEFENLHPAYDGLREQAFNEDHFTAWKEGRTGYPMVDASMRMLIATGWLNFRMRSMLMSFASYHLWLHWRPTALHLARLFTDYEPGIHYSQAQMQSGTTGINSTRIYNPIKQGQDHDPDGVFVRSWIRELSDMPQEFLQTPWRAPNQMGDYPMPIVDEKSARKEAAARIHAVRKDKMHRLQAKDIVAKHASRKTGETMRPRRKTSKRKDPAQTELPL